MNVLKKALTFKKQSKIQKSNSTVIKDDNPFDTAEKQDSLEEDDSHLQQLQLHEEEMEERMSFLLDNHVEIERKQMTYKQKKEKKDKKPKVSKLSMSYLY